LPVYPQDNSFLGYTALFDPKCELYTVGRPFETFSLSMGFPLDFDNEAIKAWSRWDVNQSLQQ
jgi:hypothetical protein